MKFIVEIPDGDVDMAIEGRTSEDGPMTPETLIQWSLEENFGVPGSGVISVDVLMEVKHAQVSS